MGTKDPRFDDYISDAADFAKPILKHLRKLVHAACPQVEETMKWSSPFFMYKGMLCHMAAFKNHCAFGFWKGSLVLGKAGPAKERQDEAMGHFGRITSLSDLPSDKVLTGYIQKAAKLNDDGVKVEKPKPAPKKELTIPDYFMAALKKHSKALETFQSFSNSHKREYVQWVTEAKREETRQQRLETAVLWMKEGKPRNWKYMNC
jgi:uncharacterized protein YdeI (YjbR/CyaY-like superfamily)